MSIKSQFVSVIEWSNPDPDILFYKWTEHGDEIKDASKLIVGPGQGCVFVYEGQVKDVYLEEGLVELESDNIPFWTTVKSVLQAGESEHKVGLYFFRKAEVINVRWGTPTPIKYMDPKFNLPVELRAFGVYSLQITQPEAFFKNVVTGAEIYSTEDLKFLFLDRITPAITDILAKGKFSYIDVDGHRSEIATLTAQSVEPVFEKMGFKMTDYQVNGTTFDEDTNNRIAKIADISTDAQAANIAGVDYAQLKQLEALKEAAATKNSMGNLAMGMSAGIGMGQMMGNMFNNANNQQQPQPADNQVQASGANDIKAKLAQLKELYDSELISEEEYNTKKQEVLSQM